MGAVQGFGVAGLGMVGSTVLIGAASQRPAKKPLEQLDLTE